MCHRLTHNCALLTAQWYRRQYRLQHLQYHGASHRQNQSVLPHLPTLPAAVFLAMVPGTRTKHDSMLLEAQVRCSDISESCHRLNTSARCWYDLVPGQHVG